MKKILIGLLSLVSFVAIANVNLSAEQSIMLESDSISNPQHCAVAQRLLAQFRRPFNVAIAAKCVRKGFYGTVLELRVSGLRYGQSISMFADISKSYGADNSFFYNTSSNIYNSLSSNQAYVIYDDANKSRARFSVTLY